MVDNMNSSRPLFENKKEKDVLIQEKDDKIKELNEKNEKIEKECVKLQIQIKGLEEKLKIKTEKEYKTNTDTSSNFILPSEFRKLWETLAKENICDCYIDFGDEPVLTFILIQKLFEICFEIFKDELKVMTEKLLDLLNIPNDKSNYNIITKTIKPIFMEHYVYIFESENVNEIFHTLVKDNYTKFVKNLINFTKLSEFNEMIDSNCFKNIVKVVKRIILFNEFHDPPLNIKIAYRDIKEIVIKNFKSIDCICIDGLVKDNKNYIILLNPPLLKNGYSYQGLKPIVMQINIEQEVLNENIENFLDNKFSRDTDNPIINNAVIIVNSKPKHFSKLNKSEKILNISDSIEYNQYQEDVKDNINKTPSKKLFNMNTNNDMIRTKTVDELSNIKSYSPIKIINEGTLELDDNYEFTKRIINRTNTVDDLQKNYIQNTHSPKKYNNTAATLDYDENLNFNQRSVSHQILVEKENYRYNDANKKFKMENLVQTSRSNYESEDSCINVGTEFVNGEYIREKNDNSIYNSFYNKEKTNKLYSDKKIHTNTYFYQSTERFDRDRNINKANIAYHNNIRNFSKTPKQSKPRVIAYSPRSNVNSIFNDKTSLMRDKISRENSIDKNTRIIHIDERNIKKRKHNSYVHNMIITNIKQNDVNYSKLSEKRIGKDSGNKNKSVDRRIFENRTNAQTRISVEELMSIKKNDKNKTMVKQDVKLIKSNFQITKQS